MPNDLTDYLLADDPSKVSELARAKAALEYFQMRIGPEDVKRDPGLLDTHRQLVDDVERLTAMREFPK